MNDQERLEAEAERQEQEYEAFLLEKYGQEELDAYNRWCEEQEREHEAYLAAGGLSICPKCEQRTYRDTPIPTRQYGGGFDTIYHCENPECGHGDVAT